MEIGEFSPKALRSLTDSTARLNIWEGAVRSSKTFTSVIRWIDYANTAPPGPLIMAGKTERTLKANILDIMGEIVGPRNWKYTEGTGEARLLGRKVLIRGANDQRAEEKIRGVTCAGAYGDELTIWPESFFKMLLSRLSVRGAKFFGTTNPDSPYHYLKTEYLDRQEELDLATWHFVLDDNPNLDPDYVESLKREYTGLWYKRFILGEWVAAEGAIYDMFSEEEHVIDDDVSPGQEAYFVLIDYGTSNPCVFLLLGWSAADGYVVVREYYWDSRAEGRQKTDREYADDLVRFCAGYAIGGIIVDPSASSFRAELAQRGVVTIPAENAVVDGIRAVASQFSAGRLHICRSCSNLIREISGYVWDDGAREDRPKKVHDHAVDALRYGIATLIIPSRGAYVLPQPDPALLAPDIGSF